METHWEKEMHHFNLMSSPIWIRFLLIDFVSKASFHNFSFTQSVVCNISEFLFGHDLLRELKLPVGGTRSAFSAPVVMTLYLDFVFRITSHV